MMVIDDFSEAFAGNGAPGGIIEVAASRAYWPGATANISADNENGVQVIIVRAVNSTHIEVRLHPDEGVIQGTNLTRFVANQRPDLTAYTTAKNAKISVPRQTIFWMPGGGDVPKIPNFWQ
jgi:hypothetical protein